MTPRHTDPELDRLLQNMEALAQQTRAEQRARILNLAGDLCFDADRREQALRYHGAAIDALLVEDRLEPAAATCRKVIAVRPLVVRTRCTLAWIALARGWEAEARRQVKSYARAARGAGAEPAALPHLRRMGELCDLPAVRRAVADALLDLDDVPSATLLYTALTAPPLDVESEPLWPRIRELVLH